LKPVALVTDEKRGLYHDDGALPEALAALGIDTIVTRWDRERDWRAFSAAIVRTPWNYHQEFAAFSGWLDRLDAAGVPLWNPTAIIRWNANKSYLLELAAAGLPVIPTRRLDPEVGLAPHVRDWGDVVVKPEVGAGGAWTFRAQAATTAEVEAALAGAGDRAFLVQPFDPAVLRGEWSLVYFDGVFSHAVFKVAAGGAFLIHEEYGGRVQPAEPSAALRAVADRFATARGTLPYARVDLLGDGADARLVELELIEPELFFRFCRDAPARFAAAVARRLDTGPPTP
jgi:glutathione synthase/RimK-type ligase-like ATP-grasp enzyme